MRWISLIVCVALCAMLLASGCAGAENRWASNGGLVGSWKGPYVVVNHAGTSIADVWVLKNAYVAVLEGSEGWTFQDKDGNAVSIGGDVKVIRCKSEDELANWHEYHAEFETQTYQEKFIKG